MLSHSFRPFLLLLASVLLLALVIKETETKATTPSPTTGSKGDSNKNQPGKVTHVLQGNESSWVPGVSAAVIVLIVFLISIFACCIHCPFCLVYKRNSNQRVV